MPKNETNYNTENRNPKQCCDMSWKKLQMKIVKIWVMPFFQSPNMWLEIKMQLNKYFGPISFSISTVFRTSRCVTYNIWTSSFLKPHRGFKFILFARFKDFAIAFLPQDWFSTHVTKSFKKFKQRLFLMIMRMSLHSRFFYLSGELAALW